MPINGNCKNQKQFLNIDNENNVGINFASHIDSIRNIDSVWPRLKKNEQKKSTTSLSTKRDMKKQYKSTKMWIGHTETFQAIRKHNAATPEGKHSRYHFIYLFQLPLIWHGHLFLHFQEMPFRITIRRLCLPSDDIQLHCTVLMNKVIQHIVAHVQESTRAYVHT